AAVVKEIFRLRAAGYGYSAIAKKLTADKVPAFSDFKKRKPRWHPSFIARLLNDRRAVGEMQPYRRVRGSGAPGDRPRKHDRVKDGDPIAGYSPAAVSEEEYQAAQRTRRETSATFGGGGRKRRGTRQGKHNNLWAGLLTDARDGSEYFVASKPT